MGSDARDLTRIAVQTELPRVVVAGLAGDTGKSLVSLGLVRAAVRRGVRVAPFKKGPDFIDAAWLGAAARLPGRNLDTFLMPPEAIRASLARAAEAAAVAVIEGNRGLFDGVDAEGSHSTAALARLLQAPVVLVIDATKMTRTVAALVAGCQALDDQLELRGVILNRVGTARQERVIRDAVSNATGVPVLGAIPKLDREHLPSRHLGLVTAAERPECDAALEALAATIAEHVDLDAVMALARTAPGLPSGAAPLPTAPRDAALRRPRIGVLRDAAFSFYYPENLEALEAAGAELVFISPLADEALAEIDALYAGGGFPEEHAAQLSRNEPLRAALARRIADGLPVWAECGGLIYLGRALRRGDETLPMVGALPLDTEHTPRPQGHGYVVARVDRANPFLPQGMPLRGHEFHYSRLEQPVAAANTVLALDRGVGLGAGRDGLRERNVVASYVHLHALGCPEWAPALVAAAGGAR